MKLEPVLLSTRSITESLGPTYSCNQILNASTNMVTCYKPGRSHITRSRSGIRTQRHCYCYLPRFDNRDIWYEVIEAAVTAQISQFGSKGLHQADSRSKTVSGLLSGS